MLRPLVCARLLGRLLLEAPTEDGRTNVASEIVQCLGDSELFRLANLYKDHFIRLFFREKDRTPAPSSHSSAPSVGLKNGELRNMSLPTPPSHATAKADALQRDGYRCMLSRRLDVDSLDNGLIPVDEATTGMVVHTHCTHIFAKSTNEDLSDSAQAAYAASLHAILHRFGGVDSTEELNGANVHRLENILTLSLDTHTSFDRLQLWLAKIPGMVPSTRVDFTTPDPVTLPLPEARYLRTHAACARVAHLSGVAECIAKILHEEEVTRVLAADGGSSELLKHVLVHRLGIMA
ncbi:uncharacterized protein TRAVEDRAFT_129055 [Trametes versicolor FP-101664 SS1]|uniref:uncharacterized protein n=1 Tax=Trametes versicolor (strain FP-101664) TaxID=717944 RepID=UPI00046230B3|nr:uncharacterized protein TRAVEDRAFT_129055 [Trametes versicolor FP-101664 SS1]EIW55637.1 hypothetical protein TRAVEDRAFT_129055 [Trametes versicolor FP-101664 SS1]